MKRIFLIMGLVVFMALPVGAYGATWYVKTDGTNPADCSGGNSWDTAFATIQKAIDCASAGDEIWVAKGTYTLSAQIELNKAVHLYGGFAGNETQRDERDWQANKTIVDGNGAVRCFHVTANAIVDGFEIVNGSATVRGGGVWNVDCSPTIRNCVFKNDTAASGGGINNRSRTATNMRPIIANCVFYQNSAIYGAAISNKLSSALVINCTIINNSATKKGGGIYTDTDIKITNCIIRDNTPAQIETSAGVSLTQVTYCNVENGFNGEGNIDQNPDFVDPSGGDFHLKSTSSCIDAGTNDSEIPDKDFEGDERIIDGNGDGTATADMGADEYKPQQAAALASVPTMTQWGMLLFLLMAGVVSALSLRRQA